MSISEDPLLKSWDLELHLALATIKKNELWKLPIEEAQKIFIQINKIEIPSNIVVEKVILDERYRQESRKHLEKVLKQYEDMLEEKWKEPNNTLHGEWIYAKEEEKSRNNEMDKVILHMHGGAYHLGSPESNRTFTFKFAEYTKTRVFSIDYRLAPQSQFPAPLCDSVAAYLYLLNPGLEAGFKPINPKRIVFAGESAGGGLALATLLFLRDAGLPLPGGVIGMSPWVDLTHSMPSFWDAEIDKVDFLPKKLGFREIGPSSPVADEYIVNVKALSDKIAQKKPTIVGHPSFTEIPRFQLYCANEALAIPYISPMLAESLGDLPPILCQVGGLERLRDEGILFSHKAAHPHMQLKILKIILEVYDDMPHIWHTFTFTKPSQVAFERCGDFIKRVTSIENDDASMIDLLKEDVVSPSISISPSFIAMRVGTNGEIRELNETDRDCLKWDKIGVVPKDVNFSR
ncbi:38689_t:CDS:2 [Gigaspora margarita]|uniref:38689_t:CDS:1 n=1 Tax=Gigaspora margarita TaxID=4874 RepID=A0ABN7VRT8_GIGMA|nr:38689_t:CDS:2 [Gigaspora margarita]